MGEDGDLYVLRYGRLIGDIEHQLGEIMGSEEKVIDDYAWTNLTWLIIDQQKIIS